MVFKTKFISLKKQIVEFSSRKRFKFQFRKLFSYSIHKRKLCILKKY